MTSSWPGLNESKPKISFRTLRGTKVNIKPDLYSHKEENFKQFAKRLSSYGTSALSVSAKQKAVS
jgi:hypothetical protein